MYSAVSGVEHSPPGLLCCYLFHILILIPCVHCCLLSVAIVTQRRGNKERTSAYCLCWWNINSPGGLPGCGEAAQVLLNLLSGTGILRHYFLLFSMTGDGG